MAAEKQENCRPQALPVSNTPYPLLVYSHGEDCMSFCNVTDPNEIHLRRIPKLQGKDFWASCHGWSLFSDKDRLQIFLWNPISMEKIRLPSLNFKGSIEHCTFSSSPSDDPNCMILLSASRLPLIIFLQLGNHQWTELDYDKEFDKCLKVSGELVQPHDDDDNYPLQIISCNGNLYARTFRHSWLFLIEKLKPHGIVIRSLGFRFLRCLQCIIHYKWCLVEFQWKIYRIMIGLRRIDDKEVVSVGIYRLDPSEMVFHKVEDVPYLVFFVHNYGSFCCQAIEPEIHGNRIYFPLNSSLYSYNIGDRILSVSRPLSHIESPYYSFWIMPDQRSVKMEEQAKIAQEKCSKKQVKLRESNVVLEKGGHSEKLEEKNLCDLPLDIVAQIVGRIILVDYLHLRSTCRMYRSISPLIDWNKALNDLEIDPSLSPWLIFFEKKCDADSTFLFNLFTKQIIPFPTAKFPLNTSANYIGFSCYPTQSDCLVVVIVQILNREFDLYLTRTGGERWVDVDELHDEIEFIFFDNSLVFYKGAFYCLGNGGNLGVLEFIDDEVTWKVLSKLTRPYNLSYHQNFLVECKGELLSVFVGKFGKEFHVFRLNDSSMEWIKVESLGNYMIFISHSSSFATMATSHLMENKIYFPRFCGQSGYDIWFYSLNTNKFHSFESKD
ncbi:hypothetical protein REPUB_Repub05bG0025100 [Reevesia pubescens]